MNLLHLSRADTEGGAAQATYQIHSMLRDAGHRSILAVRRKASSDSDVIPVGVRSLGRCSWPERMERVRSRLEGGYRVEPRPFCTFNRNLAPVPDWDAALKILPKPDVVFLHWITHLMTAADIRRLAERVDCPLVWFLMDMEPMTGGCHYPGNCVRFQSECKECPQLQPGGGRDWAGRTWHEKLEQLADLPITFLAATSWLAERLARSGLFRSHSVAKIPIPIHPRMQPVDKSVARKILGLPTHKKIILVGSQNMKDPRKGMDLLVAATRLLAARGALGGGRSVGEGEVLFLLLGSNGSELAREIPFPSQQMGYVRDDIVLSLVYSVADVFVCPSLEDAGPMMVSQAMMCGTPVLAFRTGIVPELIVSGETGHMAEGRDATSLAEGLEILVNHPRLSEMGAHAAAVAARHHDPARITEEMNHLLSRLIAGEKR